MRSARGQDGHKRELRSAIILSANGKPFASSFIVRSGAAVAFDKGTAIERPKLFREKFAVSPNQLPVKVDFAAAVIRPLNADHVPMHLASVPVIGFIVSLAGGEMKRAGDFLVEQNVTHRLQDVRVECEREFTDVTSPRVGIENLIQLFRLVALCIDNLAIAKFEANSVETNALINCRRVKSDVALNGILDRRGEDFAVRDIAIASTDHRGNSLDPETQVRLGC